MVNFVIIILFVMASCELPAIHKNTVPQIIKDVQLVCTQFSMETRTSLFTAVYHIVGKTGTEFKLAVW